MNHFSPPKINRKTYAWSVRAFSTVKRMLGVNIKLHADDNQVERGHIFLFNHFARFETFIPQYLIYQEQKAYCRSVAASEFFGGNDRFTDYLYAVGAVPNDMPGLLSFLARDILKGRKIIIFPEGGMVKDKKIMSSSGDYSVYSPSAEERRKHHTGAARLALMLDIYKQAVLNTTDHKLLENFTRELGLNSIDTLIQRCSEPTQLVPSNITFYPIRITDNFLKDSVERLNGNLSPKYAEELLIEGNIVLKHTDMDIRMGHPIQSGTYLSWLEKLILTRCTNGMCSLAELFNIGTVTESLRDKFIARALRQKTEALRDQSMHQMYGLVTINLSHLASILILHLIDQGIERMVQSEFLRILYLMARYVSHENRIYLHRSLLKADTYRGIHDGSCPEFKQFLKSSQKAGLLNVENKQIIFLAKLREEHDFHSVRMENPICVYANECASIQGVHTALERALSNQLTLKPQQWARYFHEDELHAHQQAKEQFSKAEFDEINQQETATQDGRPFFLQPDPARAKRTAVLLLHGFLASPAEMRGLGDDFLDRGHTVYGARLEGHGTSPCDLRDRSWQDWMRSVKRGYEILSSCSDHIAIVGFSTGGALTLRFAADRPEKLAGICAVSTPLKFSNPNLVFVPLIHHANRLAKWLAAQEGILPYIINESEHPNINYKHIPVRALHELRLLVAEMEDNLQRINCPSWLIQGDEEKVVNPESANLIREQMVGTTPKVHMVPSTRHGIITENIGQTRQHIFDFIDLIEERLNND
ncbi:alpha/beta fold hydrolase [Terasakiella sp. A23]|uniref:alpha/beta fold hydrolase n=1 Tax=Terasakiella sp. FCG-A23 TaxID=3080561 RepID=UPI002952BD56|nr:alpha/beta fold hydrolase [Terasakiella sp. A23]MDV7338715.1 alpha/beta fold hydrolase [Terasakiella sp. A23]